MVDDKSKRGPADRGKVAGGQEYEVEYFRRKHNIPLEKAKEIIKRHGPDREKADQAAERYNKRNARNTIAGSGG